MNKFLTCKIKQLTGEWVENRRSINRAMRCTCGINSEAETWISAPPPFIVASSYWLPTNAHRYIWKCGKLVAGKTQPSSSSLDVSSWTVRQWLRWCWVRGASIPDRTRSWLLETKELLVFSVVQNEERSNTMAMDFMRNKPNPQYNNNISTNEWKNWALNVHTPIEFCLWIVICIQWLFTIGSDRNRDWEGGETGDEWECMIRVIETWFYYLNSSVFDLSSCSMARNTWTISAIMVGQSDVTWSGDIRSRSTRKHRKTAAWTAGTTDGNRRLLASCSAKIIFDYNLLHDSGRKIY